MSEKKYKKKNEDINEEDMLIEQIFKQQESAKNCCAWNPKKNCCA